MVDTSQSGSPKQCGLCGKCCESRKQYLRHSSYCRKARTRVTSRKKSCLACTKSKTRCDLTFPKCSRCESKNLPCGYEWSPKGVNLGPNAAAHTPHLDSRTAVDIVEPMSTELISRRSGDISLDRTQKSTRIEHSTPTSNFQSNRRWSGGLIDTISELPSITDTNEPYQFDTYAQSWNVHFDAFDIESIQSFPQVLSQEDIYTTPLYSSQLPTMASSTGFISVLELDQVIPKAAKAFMIRKVDKKQNSMNRSFVLCVLRTYAGMMLPGRDLPPFIHPFYACNKPWGAVPGQNAKQSSLENCTAIVQMYSVKNSNNTIFIWRAIRMEQERILAEYPSYTERECVGALQAITIYLLLRISEANEEATNFDMPLIWTMLKVAVKLNGAIMKNDSPFDHDMPTWENWILAESLRRTIIVQILIDLLFHVSTVLPFHMCDGSNLSSLALPSGRKLWNATTRNEWESHYIAEQARNAGKKPLTYRDLMNFHLRPEGTFDHWLEQVDDFGTLVMAASSIQHWSDASRV